MNCSGFIAFMSDQGYEDSNDENSFPRSLRDLIKYSTNIDSNYHYLGLLSINELIWNLDIKIYLLNAFNLQVSIKKLKGISLFYGIIDAFHFVRKIC